MTQAAEPTAGDAMTSTDTLVEVHDVTKTFFRGTETLEVLTHVDFHMKPGESKSVIQVSTAASSSSE